MYAFYYIDYLKYLYKEVHEMDFTITADTVKPVTDALSSGLAVLVPVGIGIMATFVGISLIPRIIYKFL